jgi:hypothetical protein
MEIDQCNFCVDQVIKYYGYLRIAGWFDCDTGDLESIAISGAETLAVSCQTRLPHGGVAQTLGPNRGFFLQALLKTDQFPETADVVFVTNTGKTITVSLQSLIDDRNARYEGARKFQEFRQRIESTEDACVLEIGGRDRSELNRAQYFPTASTTVVDILPGPNVDIVCDAHRLSSSIAPASFDFAHSSSVFEHLIMPWKVAVEINHCLKIGGEAYFSTHQTLGLHDVPWDYWRFSKDCWEGLFNEYTGFEIIEKFQEREQSIVPWLATSRNRNTEGSIGYEASAVWVRKVGPASVDWSVDPLRIITTEYPTTPDQNTE